MTIYYLYVKTHKITGLQYLGYTAKKDPYKYIGSGKYWLNHLNKHGHFYDTHILHRCISKSAIRAWGIFYSRLWSIVKSKKWANLIEENGGGRGCFGKVNGMFGKKRPPGATAKANAASVAKTKGKTYEELYGSEKANLLKKKRSDNLKGKDNSYKNNPRFDPLHYTFLNTKSGELIYCSRWIFIKCYNINKTGVCDMINRGIIYKDWCILFN